MKKPDKLKSYNCPYNKSDGISSRFSEGSVGGRYCKNNCGLYRRNECKLFKRLTKSH